jgi:hypothetical protein
MQPVPCVDCGSSEERPIGVAACGTCVAQSRANHGAVVAFACGLLADLPLGPVALRALKIAQTGESPWAAGITPSDLEDEAHVARRYGNRARALATLGVRALVWLCERGDPQHYAREVWDLSDRAHAALLVARAVDRGAARAAGRS